MDENKTDLDLEWEKRILCSDENCIGVTGLDGRCKECGKPYDKDSLAKDAVDLEEVNLQQTDDSQMEISDVSGEAPAESVEDTDPDWESRRLCSDGNCIGVIGADGRCKECGKPFEG